MLRLVVLLSLPLLGACPGGVPAEVALDAAGAAEAFQLGRGQQVLQASDPSQERLDKAIEQLERAATLDATRVEHHYFAGRAREDRGDHLEARRHYEHAVERDAQHALARWRLGRALHREGELAGARTQLERAREKGLGKDQPSLLVDLGRVYEDQGDLDGARDVYRTAIDLRAGETQAWYRLAQVLRLLGDEPGADAAAQRYDQCWQLEQDLAAARHAARLTPGDARTHMAVARAAAGLGLDGLARDACLAVLQLAPGHAEAQRLLAGLKESQ